MIVAYLSFGHRCQNSASVFLAHWRWGFREHRFHRRNQVPVPIGLPVLRGHRKPNPCVRSQSEVLEQSEPWAQGPLETEM